MHDVVTKALLPSDDQPSAVEPASLAPASYAQRRLWFFDRLEPGSAIYNVNHTEMLAGSYHAAALQNALDEIIRRHEALRTTFKNVGGSPVQVVGPAEPALLAHFDLRNQSKESRDKLCRQIIADDDARGFDLETGPLIRFTVIELDQQVHMLLMVAHHIVFDLWSAGVFTREFRTLYEAFQAGRASPLAPLALRYSTFVAAQRDRFEGAAPDPQVDYWLKQLHDLPARSELPIDRPRPLVQTYRGAIRTFWVAGEVADDFRQLTRSANSTLFMGLVAAFAVLVHRYSGQADLAIGTPIANRGKPGLGDMIGFLLNMLALRIDLSDDPTVTTLLARVRETSLKAFENQDMPFELLMEKLRPERDTSRSPLFQTMFVFQPGGPSEEPGVREDVVSNGSKFDVTLQITDAAPRLKGALEYNTDLFEPATVDRLIDHYERVIMAMAATPQARVSELEILSAPERQQILKGWNDTRVDRAPATCLHHLFEQMAAAHPDAIAVSCGEEGVSYRMLDERARSLAGSLNALGFGRGTRIGICMERSIEWIVAIFGALKAGGAIVPLDISFPAARLEFMIEDAGVPVILTQKKFAAKLSGSAARLICRDDAEAVLPAGQPGDGGVTPFELAYVVYTSGSTGRPKGVIVQHDSVVNFMIAQIADWRFAPGARVLQFTAFGFDIGLSEIFMTLCSGARFCLAPAEDLMPGPPLLRTLRDLRITHVTLPPSALAAMQPESLPDLRLMISAGEPCEPGLARRWSHGRPIVNAYGPTEATIYATIGAYDATTGQFPIGRPIANMQVYVLDRRGAPVPPGVTGEIHIGGVGVAGGYLNRPELTQERFIADPFSGRPGARLYKTGDLGRFDAKGTLHYLGRADVQLKIRGYRIEPGEIESVLRQHPGVTDALVMALGSGPDARLVAYVIAADPPPLVVELRGFLARHLPDYMAPAAYVMVDKWPKNANGKIDRAALPRPESLARDVAATFVAPVNELEQTIAAIWRDCLGVAQVGATDNFFDLGGHSLLLVRVHDRLKDALKMELSLIDLFRFPTVKLQAEMIRARTSPRTEIETIVVERTDRRAARQNAARLQRRLRTGAERHA